MLLRGSNIRYSRYLNAKRKITKIKNEFIDIFDTVNKILLLPTTVIQAPKLRKTYVNINNRNLKARDLLLRNTIVFNSIGFPSLTIPLNKHAVSQSILPIGIQIVGAPHADDLVLRTGVAIEEFIAAYLKSDRIHPVKEKKLI
jgi:aspartyl-tRNA(Asn)/glutamyl-tRNA(Gln) amidotransferase subunit A